MFTKNCAKEVNNFTPFRTGRLKDSSVELGKDFIKYNTHYAKKQYYTNKGEGLQGESNGGLRGKFWDKRMWILKGASIIKELAKFIGGHTK